MNNQNKILSHCYKSTYKTGIILLVVLLSCNILTMQGARNKGKDFDLQGFINSEISAGKKTIVVPPGTYRVKPKDRQHLCFKNLKDITIIADNVEMICTETTRAITFEKCRNVTFRGITIDYDPLCFSQGTITHLSPDKSTIDFKLEDNYPDNLVESIEIFNPKTGNLKRSTYYGWAKFKKTGDRQYQISKDKNYTYNPEIDIEEVGDILVANNEYAPNGKLSHAVCSEGCVKLNLENITLYSGNCFGFFEVDGTKNKYYRCAIDRRLPETDMYQRAKRMRSNDADAFHSKYAYVGPQLIECSSRYQGDDGVNINGKYYMSVGADKNTIRLIDTGNCDLKVGSALEVLTVEGKKIPDVKILKIEDDGIISQNEINTILKFSEREENKVMLTQPNNKILKLTINKEVKFNIGALIADKNRIGSGFLVKNCNFSNNRSRGIIIKANNGQVINNTLHGNWMTAILVSPEIWWLEAACADNIKVSGNIISDNLSKNVIDINGNGFEESTPQAGLHNNIVIENNKITNCYLPAIYVASTKNGSILGNKIINPKTFDKDNVKPEAIVIKNCENFKSDF
jgi:parallel beta-helix repeat protein